MVFLVPPNVGEFIIMAQAAATG